MAEYHPLMGRDVIAAVVQAYRRRLSLRIQHQYPNRDPGAVETIGQCINANCSDNEPQRVDRLAPLQRQTRDGTSTYQYH